jgi:hypothetical protein
MRSCRGGENPVERARLPRQVQDVFLRPGAGGVDLSLDSGRAEPSPADGGGADLCGEHRRTATGPIGVTVWNKAGGLWFASKWDGTRTVEQLFGGGNLVVR